MKLPKELTTITPFSKFLALALFLVLPFVGFQLGMQYQQVLDQTKQSEIVNAIHPTPTISTLPTTDSSIIANWKTYFHPQLKYSFKYPQEFVIDENFVNTDDPNETVMHVMYVSSPDRKDIGGEGFNGLTKGIRISVIQEKTHFSPSPYIKYSTVIIDGQNAYQYDNRDFFTITTNLNKGNLSYGVWLDYARHEGATGREKAIEIYNKVLQSFKL